MFGQNVFNEMDASLCYTPSPGPSENAANLAGSKTKTNTNIIKSILEEGESSSQSTPAPTILFQPDTSDDPLSITNNTSEKRVSFAQDEKENTIGSVSRDTPLTSKTSSLNSIRNTELNRLRASTKQSPMRRNLVKMTEAAIDDATTSLKSSALKEKNNSGTSSVYQSLNAGRTARLKVLREKNKTAKSVSFQWDQENAQAKSLQIKVEENRRQIRAIQRKLTSAHFKDKARHGEEEKMVKDLHVREQP